MIIKSWRGPTMKELPMWLAAYAACGMLIRRVLKKNGFGFERE